MSKQPNIIIINPDEMRWNTMGHMGNPAAHTPNLDAFARTEAVSFDHAYCQNPVCVPSRCSFFTGLYPHVNGHRTMAHLLRSHETSMLKELKDAGYYVWMNARNDLVAGQVPGLVESHASEIFYNLHKNAPKANPQALMKMMAGSKSEYPYSHFKGVVPDSSPQVQGDLGDALGAIDRILHPVDDRPLCLFLGWQNPHPPYMVEQKYYDRIDAHKIEEILDPKDTQDKCKLEQALRTNQKMDSYTTEQWKEMRHVYLAQCAMVDDLFQMVCQALKEAGIYDNSAIFFLSDHGDYAGDYHIPEKAQNSFEDVLTRVPFLIKPPKGEALDAGVSHSLVELVDFYATALDYAGVEPSHDHFGKTLRPVIGNREEKVRKYAFCEGGRRPGEIQADEWHIAGPNGQNPAGEYYPRQLAQSIDENHMKGTMISDGNFKYIERLDGSNELYDLKNDPGEVCNIYQQQKDSPKVLELQRALLHWYQETCDVVPREYDSRFSAEMIWAKCCGMCPPELEEDAKAFIATGADIQVCIRYVMQRVLEMSR